MFPAIIHKVNVETAKRNRKIIISPKATLTHVQFGYHIRFIFIFRFERKATER